MRSAKNNFSCAKACSVVSIAFIFSACILPEVGAATSVGSAPGQADFGESAMWPTAPEAGQASLGMESVGRSTSTPADAGAASTPTPQNDTQDASAEPMASAPAPSDSRPHDDGSAAMAQDPNAAMNPINGGVAADAMAADIAKQHAFALWPMPDSTPGSLAAPSYTASADTVLDNVTHLVWQRTLPPVYQGCTGKAQDNGPAGTNCYWEEAKKCCASPALASWLGGMGWRLPTLIELASLIELTRSKEAPTIDTTAFPQTPEGIFYSSTPLMNDLPTIGIVNLIYGSVQHGPTGPGEWATYVRCVRSQEPAASLGDRYEIQSSEVLDRFTGLHWARDAAPDKLDWMHAVDYCKGRGQGWRLPAQKELLTLVDPTVPSPLIDQKVFPNLVRGDMTFWTGTANLDISVASWVDFSRGWSAASNGSEQNKVRCVR